MNNIIVYCETDGGRLCDVSLELMTKARDLAAELSCDVEALLIGHNVKGLAAELYAYGAKLVHIWRMIHVWSISAHCPMRP